MGKLRKFDICFANASDAFYSGSVIEGHVNVVVSEPLKIRAIMLSFVGKGSVHWSESRGSGDSRRTEHFRAKEDYLNTVVYLLGGEQNGNRNTIELIQGSHTFPFTVLLPSHLPSTFKSPISYIKYLVACKIDRFHALDGNIEKPFTVISNLDLNRRPHCAYPTEEKRVQHLCCLCCASGPIQASFRIDKKGWVAGERLIFHAKIHNGTSRIANCSVELKMKLVYSASGGQAKGQERIAKVTLGDVDPYKFAEWDGGLIVPSTTPSFLEGCSFIDLRYKLQLIVDPVCATRMKLPLEIVIGTIPLRSAVRIQPSVSGLQPSALFSSQTSLGRAVTTQPTASPPPYGATPAGPFSENFSFRTQTPIGGRVEALPTASPPPSGPFSENFSFRTQTPIGGTGTTETKANTVQVNDRNGGKSLPPQYHRQQPSVSTHQNLAYLPDPC